MLAGCETSSNSSGNAVVGSLTATQQQVQAKPVAFAPVIGAPAKVSSKMNESLAAAAGQKNIRVASSQDAEYTIRGYLVAAADAKGTKLSYIWDITDKSGKRAKRLQGDELIEGKKGGDPWALVDDAAIQRISAKTADEISSWMSTGGTATAANAPAAAQAQNAPPAAAQPQKQASASEPSANVLSVQTPQTTPRPQTTATAEPAGPAAVVVQPVTGAPGDGQTSLTDAMRRHLEAAGVKVASGSAPNAYTVKGSVQLGTADSGQQPITIRWLVVDPSGKTMEKAVVQRNKVPEGSLDGTWGQIADLAAGEAAKSVAKLLKQQGQG
ncbi:MAG: hypothetical protein WBP94_05790 [Rhodomicrobiaceae bacterium]